MKTIGNISIPKYYSVENPRLVKINNIETVDQNSVPNGFLAPLANEADPHQPQIELTYLTICFSKSVKGPHVHLPPKIDRFVCVKGQAVIVCRNEQTQEMFEIELDGDMVKNTTQMLVIPPFNSHAIVSKRGCTVLSICNERFYPGSYNQQETSYENYDFNKWFR